MAKKTSLYFGLAAATAGLICASWWLGIRQDRHNQRFERCLVQQAGGKSNFGYISDILGRTVMVDPAIKLFGMEYIGRRKGVIIPDSVRGLDPLMLTLQFNSSGHYEGSWKRPEAFGISLAPKSLGYGNIAPSVEQKMYGQMVVYCANQIQVLRPA